MRSFPDWRAVRIARRRRPFAGICAETQRLRDLRFAAYRRERRRRLALVCGLL
jgi:hypothetical protein